MEEVKPVYLPFLTRRRMFEPKKILLTRLSAIGDCVLTIPVAVRVKQLWPNSHLSWIVDCRAGELLEQHSAIDEVIQIERGWLKRPGQWPELRRQLRDQQFDLVLDPQGLTKSALLGWFSGASTRVGLDYSHGREIAPWLATRRVKRRARHMVDTYLQVLSPWTEVAEGQAQFDMPQYSKSAQTAERILTQLNLLGAHWVALNPGAGWTTRLWPVERFGMLAREILREHGRRSVVFWAGESEALMARVVEEESQGAAVMAPKTSLTEMLELLRGASLMVTGDTGPMHIASSVGTPCVSLHGPTWSDESGPYGNRHFAIQSPTPPMSRKMMRKGPNISMQAIELTEVIRACQRMFNDESQAPSGLSPAA